MKCIRFDLNDRKKKKIFRFSSRKERKKDFLTKRNLINLNQRSSTQLHTTASSRRFWSFFEFSSKEENCQDAKKCPSSKDIVSTSLISTNEVDEVSKSGPPNLIRNISTVPPPNLKRYNSQFDLKSKTPISCLKLQNVLKQDSLVSLLDGNPVPKTLKWKLKGYKTLRNEQAGDFAFVPGGKSYDFDILTKDEQQELINSGNYADRSRAKARNSDAKSSDTICLTTKSIENVEEIFCRNKLIGQDNPIMDGSKKGGAETVTASSQKIPTATKLLVGNNNPNAPRKEDIKYLPILKTADFSTGQMKYQTQPSVQFSSKPPKNIPKPLPPIMKKQDSSEKKWVGETEEKKISQVPDPSITPIASTQTTETALPTEQHKLSPIPESKKVDVPVNEGGTFQFAKVPEPTVQQQQQQQQQQELQQLQQQQQQQQQLQQQLQEQQQLQQLQQQMQLEQEKQQQLQLEQQKQQQLQAEQQERQQQEAKEAAKSMEKEMVEPQASEERPAPEDDIINSKYALEMLRADEMEENLEEERSQAYFESDRNSSRRENKTGEMETEASEGEVSNEMSRQMEMREVESDMNDSELASTNPQVEPTKGTEQNIESPSEELKLKFFKPTPETRVDNKQTGNDQATTYFAPRKSSRSSRPSFVMEKPIMNISSPYENEPRMPTSPCAATQAKLLRASSSKHSHGSDMGGGKASSMAGNSGGGSRKPPSSYPPFTSRRSASNSSNCLTKKLPIARESEGGLRAIMMNTRSPSSNISTSTMNLRNKNKENQNMKNRKDKKCNKKECKRYCCPALQTPTDCDYTKFQCPNTKHIVNATKMVHYDPTCLPQEDEDEIREICTDPRAHKKCNRDR